MNKQFNNAAQTNVDTVSDTGQAPNESSSVCPNCQYLLSEGQKFCPRCGSESPREIKCKNCGADISVDTMFCPECGQKTFASKKEKTKYNKKLYIIGVISILSIFILGALAIGFILREIPVENIELSESVIELTEEETKNISCTVSPENATDKTVTWSSSDDSVATVNSYGMITAVKKGTCVITAQSGEQTKTINVTVEKKHLDFSALYNEIDSDAKYGWKLGSDGSCLMVDTNVYEIDDFSSSAVYYSIKDMNKKMGLPDSLTTDMERTTALMGRQSKTYANIGVEVTWTYHPDHGLEVTYTLILD